MEDLTEKLVILQKVLGVRRLINFGSSYAVVIPKEWADLFCLKSDDHRWISLSYNQDKNQIILSPLSREEVDSIIVEEKNDRCR